MAIKEIIKIVNQSHWENEFCQYSFPRWGIICSSPSSLCKSLVKIILDIKMLRFFIPWKLLPCKTKAMKLFWFKVKKEL